jgi:hypothetical protein
MNSAENSTDIDHLSPLKVATVQAASSRQIEILEETRELRRKACTSVEWLSTGKADQNRSLVFLTDRHWA